MSLPPSSWDKSAGWRETHLYRFTQPEDMAALRLEATVALSTPGRSVAVRAAVDPACPGTSPIERKEEQLLGPIRVESVCNVEGAQAEDHRAGGLLCRICSTRFH